MSGGVDSSVAALLLKKAGYGVVGVFMRCWSQGSSDALGIGEPCGSERDGEDARRVAGHLDIPFYVWDFEEEYKKRVVEYMIDGYRKGQTPNPDVECNREIKFGLFFDRARSLGADYVATGHYVRLRQHNTNLRMDTNTTNNAKNIRSIRPSFVAFALYTARDAQKDQSYFLWTLTQKQLAHCLFPIGEYTKPQVRAIARRAGLPTANKKDSQGICFLGNVSIQDFLRQYLPERRGAVLATDGRKIGEHAGAHFYTIGQRHLGPGVRYQASGIRKNGKDPKPLYVAEKNVRTNTLVMAEGEKSPALYRKELTLRGVNFISPQHSHFLKKVRMSVMARVRYRQPLSPAHLLFSNSRELENKRMRIGRNVKVIFKKPQKFVAPGQSAVFYVQESSPSSHSGRRAYALRMIGGGIIV